SGDSNLRIGDPSVPTEPFDGGQIQVAFAADKVDNLNFPRHGYIGSLEWRGSRDALGADEGFEQAELSYLGAFTPPRHTLYQRARLGTTFSGTAPIESLFREGGFLNLSGLSQNALSGQQVGFLSVGTLRRIGDFALLPAYVGTALELGNVWQDRDDVGL